MRFVNTAGPVRAEDHCAIPTLDRGKVDEVPALVSAMLLGDGLPATVVRIASPGPVPLVDAARLVP